MVSFEDYCEQFREQANLFLSSHGRIKMLLCVRSDLGMTKGKVCAQVGHATLGAITKYLLKPRSLLMMKPASGGKKNSMTGDGENDAEDDEEDEDDCEDEDEDEDEDDDEEIRDDDDFSNEELEKLLYGDSDDDSSAEDEQSHLNSMFATALIHAAEFEDTIDNPEANVEAVEASLKAAMGSTSAIYALSQQINQKKLTYDEILKSVYSCDVPMDVLMRFVIAKWIKVGQAKIAVKVKDEAELKGVKASLRKAGIPTFDVHDAGHTQVASGSLTVMAIGPFPEDIINPICSHLKLL